MLVEQNQQIAELETLMEEDDEMEEIDIS